MHCVPGKTIRCPNEPRSGVDQIDRITDSMANSARIMGTRRRVRQRFIGIRIAVERSRAAVECKHLVTPKY